MNWSLAYDNSRAVAGSEHFLAQWQATAETFRQRQHASARLDLRYGEHARQAYDLFLPADGHARALLVHVHGGYWMRTDKSCWSHCAAGALAHGLAVAIPSYRLCPEVSVASITSDVSRAIEAAGRKVDGPIVLSGHSAGGHLVTRQLCNDTTLDAATRSRVCAALSISGLHDLRPLIKTAMNDTLQLSTPTARAESPALLEPRADTHLYAWVGADELPELRRQTALLKLMWQGQLETADATEAPGKHHFDVIDALEDPQSGMLQTLLAHC